MWGGLGAFCAGLYAQFAALWALCNAKGWASQREPDTASRRWFRIEAIWTSGGLRQGEHGLGCEAHKSINKTGKAVHSRIFLLQTLLRTHGILARTGATWKALMDAAIEKKEIVLVTDDVLKIKDQFLEALASSCCKLGFVRFCSQRYLCSA